MSNGKNKGKKPKYHKIPEEPRTRWGEKVVKAKMKKATRTKPTLGEKITAKGAKIRDNFKRNQRDAIIAARDAKLDRELKNKKRK